MNSIFPLLLGGLALFLLAIHQLSELLKEFFSEHTKGLIARYTNSLFSSILIGFAATALIGSSSAVIIIAIVLVNSEVLNFRRTIGIVLGANIGTTVSSQIFALDVAQYAFIVLLLGIFLSIILKNKQLKEYASVLMYFGMLFFGLHLMELSVEPLHESGTYEEWIARLDSPIQGALAGGLITLILQSSSAAVGLAIVLGKQGLIGAAGGIAVMLGAELGTCSDTLIATIGGSRQGLKVGIFHLTFNLLTIAIGLLLFHPLVQFVEFVSVSGAGIDRQIANAHMLFNTAGVLLTIPLVPVYQRLLDRILPDSSPETESDPGSDPSPQKGGN